MGTGAALDALTAFLAARDDADAAVAPAMRSFVLPGTGHGLVVLLHGLTASPPAWHGIAAALQARGRTVVVPRLLLHGHADRLTPALRGLTADALVDDTTRVLSEAAALGEALTVAGHSLGATLAVDAAVRSAHVTRVVAVAPFLGFAQLPHEAHGMLLPLLQRARDVFVWWNPFVRERLMPAHGYPRYPLGSLAVGLELAERLRATAHAPPRAAIDLVLNAGESSVSNRAVRKLAADWRAAGASVAIHRLRGLGWSHDIIEPARRAGRAAQATLVDIIDGEHLPLDREHRIAKDPHHAAQRS